MRNILVALMSIGLAGCAMVLPEVTMVEKRPAVPSGYVLAKYTVKCPGVNNSLELVPVNYYGPDFSVTDAFRLDEYRKSCQDQADGEADARGQDDK